MLYFKSFECESIRVTVRPRKNPQDGSSLKKKFEFFRLIRAANQVPFHERSAAHRKIVFTESTNANLSVLSPAHYSRLFRLVAHCGIDSFIFSHFLFFFTWGAEFFFFIHSFPLNNCSDRQRCHDGWNGVSRWHKNGRRDVTRRPSKRHSHDKKTLRGPEMTEVTCSRPKMAKKTNAGRKCFTTFTLHPSEKVATLGPKPKKNAHIRSKWVWNKSEHTVR